MATLLHIIYLKSEEGQTETGTEVGVVGRESVGVPCGGGAAPCSPPETKCGLPGNSSRNITRMWMHGAMGKVSLPLDIFSFSAL